MSAVPDVLDREMYTVSEAARLLEVSPSTLRYWLEGGEQRGKHYRPVIRQEPERGSAVTWAEFVEAGLLREYRRTHRIPMSQLRDFIDDLRQQLGVPYPLAHERPFISGRDLVLRAQQASQLDADFQLVVFANDQLLLTPAADSFVNRVEWHDGIAAALKPAADRRSTVRIDPELRFGRPSVAGVSTSAIFEQSESGEPAPVIADMFGIDVRDVRWAIAYETALTAA